MSDDSKYEVPISGGQGVLVGGGTQYNYYDVNTKSTSAPSTPEHVWNVPFPRNRFFTGREEVLVQLEQSLAETKKAALTSGQGQAISGLGGVGKTQTAVEYAYRHRQEYRAVFWVQAETAVTLDGAFGRIAILLDLPEKDTPEIEKTREAVKRWLATESDYLLILDNADDPEILKAFLPPQPAGHVLITSRARDLGTLPGAFAVAAPIPLPMLTREQSVAFLLARTEKPQTQGADLEAATALARELGGLPLALEQVGAYIGRKGLSFTDYLASYRKRAGELLKNHKPEMGDSQKTVAVTWSLNFEAVEQESAAAAELLRLSAFLAPERIPEELLTGGADDLGDAITEALRDVADDPLRLEELFEPLDRYSLIERDKEKHTYDIHRLVQAVIQDRMGENMRRAYAKRTVCILNAIFEPVDYTAWPLCERLLPHALLCADQINAYQFTSVEAADLLNKTGYYLQERAQYVASEPLYKRALDIRETVLGQKNLDTATSLNNLADLYNNQGKYTEAETLCKRALKIKEQLLGTQHPDTALNLNNMAVLYIRQGKYDEAEPLLERALEISEKVSGPRHHDTVASLNNLAFLYSSLGKYVEAEPMLQRALEICEILLGPQHPDTATSLNNLAALYMNQNKYTEAEPMLKRALEIREKALEAQHPDVARSLHNLAGLYSHQDQYSKAELFYKRTLEIYEIMLGPQHPDTAGSLTDLAALYSNQGKHTEAEPVLKRALEIYEKTLGSHHPDTINVRGNYLGLQQRLRQMANASRKPEKEKYAWWKKPGG